MSSWTGAAVLVAIWFHGMICGIMGTWTFIDRVAARSQPAEDE